MNEQDHEKKSQKGGGIFLIIGILASAAIIALSWTPFYEDLESSIYDFRFQLRNDLFDPPAQLPAIATLDIDDRQPSHPQADTGPHLRAFVIGTPVPERIDHPGELGRAHGPSGVTFDDTGDSTHTSVRENLRGGGEPRESSHDGTMRSVPAPASRPCTAAAPPRVASPG